MRKLLILSLLFSCVASWGQRNMKDSVIFAPLIHFSYAAQIPGGDLAKRFGFNSNVNINIAFKTKKNFIWGADFGFIFGNELKGGSPLDSISTHADHLIIDQNGEYPSIRIYERGFLSSAWIGKLFPVLSPNPNSGFVTSIGLGWLEYHYRIEDIGNNSPQLAGALKKGYDRLTAGPAVSGYIGYTYLSNKRMVNFFFGLEFTEGVTYGLRAYDYELERKDNSQHLDQLYGIRAGWILPLYPALPREFYYN
jgi:hypothetical protein